MGEEENFERIWKGLAMLSYPSTSRRPSRDLNALPSTSLAPKNRKKTPPPPGPASRYSAVSDTKTPTVFDVDLLPVQDLASSASTFSLREWRSVIDKELRRRAQAGQSVRTWDYAIQFALIGPAGAGKTCLFKQCTEGVFRSGYVPTPSLSGGKVLVDLDGKRIALNIWDSPQLSTYNLTFAGASAVTFFLFDVTSTESFQEIKSCLESPEIAKLPPHPLGPIKVLLGNKVDLPGREVTAKEASDFARSKKLLFMECSTATGQGVMESFGKAARQVLLSLEMGGLMLPSGQKPVGVRVAQTEGLNDSMRVFERGFQVLRDPALSKGTNFNEIERDELGLRGLLPVQSSSLETQVSRAMARLRKKETALGRYMEMMGVFDRNETLYYRLLVEFLEELHTVVFVPTVGEVCLKFGSLWRISRGLYFNYSDKGHYNEVVYNCPCKEVDLVVITDGSRVLSLGDLGASGMGISVGKVSLYVACAGIHPSRVLPCIVDVGTDNEGLQSDPLYIGERRSRVRGTEYFAIIDEVVQAIRHRWPNAIIQWENGGFKDICNRVSFDLVEQYQSRRTFNDDIQGTGGVTLAGILAALRITKGTLRSQRVLIYGAGGAGIGVADLIRDALMEEGISSEAAKRNIWLIDSKGLVSAEKAVEYRQEAKYKLRYMRTLEEAHAVNKMDGDGDLLRVIRYMHPTVLVGVSGVGGTFTEQIIREMHRFCHLDGVPPIIFALSNPTANAECSSQQAYDWTDGDCLYAAGSPMPVDSERGFVPAQASNMYIFPGVALGSILGRFKSVPNWLFHIAAKTLADMVPEDALSRKTLFPPLSSVREVANKIAAKCIEAACRRGLARIATPVNAKVFVSSSMWFPRYKHYMASILGEGVETKRMDFEPPLRKTTVTSEAAGSSVLEPASRPTPGGRILPKPRSQPAVKYSEQEVSGRLIAADQESVMSSDEEED